MGIYTVGDLQALILHRLHLPIHKVLCLLHSNGILGKDIPFNAALSTLFQDTTLNILMNESWSMNTYKGTVPAFTDYLYQRMSYYPENYEPMTRALISLLRNYNAHLETVNQSLMRQAALSRANSRPLSAQAGVASTSSFTTGPTTGSATSARSRSNLSASASASASADVASAARTTIERNHNSNFASENPSLTTPEGIPRDRYATTSRYLYTSNPSPIFPLPSALYSPSTVAERVAAEAFEENPVQSRTSSDADESLISPIILSLMRELDRWSSSLEGSGPESGLERGHGETSGSRQVPGQVERGQAERGQAERGQGQGQESGSGRGQEAAPPGSGRGRGPGQEPRREQGQGEQREGRGQIHGRIISTEPLGTIQQAQFLYNPDIHELVSISIAPDFEDNVPITISENEFEEIVEVTDESVEHPESCCPVCQLVLGESGIAILPCTHSFHVGCIRTWLTEYSCKCPACRFDVRECQEGEHENEDNENGDDNGDDNGDGSENAES